VSEGPTATDEVPAAVEYLTLEDLLGLVQALRVGPVRDLGLLDSAAHRPQASFLGEDAYPTLAGKAAALMHSLARNRALADGNKRLALLAMTVSLRINDHRLALSDDQAFDLTMAAAAGALDVAEIAKRLRLDPL
jgi:death-on-curing protein